jgi:hypothetical protein
MFTFDPATRSIAHVDYGYGKVAPTPRNSHTLSQADGARFAYLFGGADNDNGSKRDLYKLDLETLDFNVIKLEVPADVKFPYLEMHTAHVYQGNKLMIIGGRGYYLGEPIESTNFHNQIFVIDVAEGSESYGHV